MLRTGLARGTSFASASSSPTRAIALALTGTAGAVKWIDNFGIQILIYVMLGWGLNIVVGLAGLLDLGYVAFYRRRRLLRGAVLRGRVERSRQPPPAVPRRLRRRRDRGRHLRPDHRCPDAAAARRLPGHRDAGLRRDLPPGADQLGGVTNGYAGVSGIPRLPSSAFRSMPATRASPRCSVSSSPRCTAPCSFYYVILALAFLTAFVTLRLRRLPVGRAWEALREDEIACRSLGINTTNTKLTAFAMGAMFALFEDDR